MAEGGGLLTSIDDLASEAFDPTSLSPGVRSFYEETSSWQMEVVAAWSRPTRPFGVLLARLFSQRLAQLGLPLGTTDDLSELIKSQVTAVVTPQGQRLGAAWTRTLHSSGQTMYSGWYGVTQLPLSSQPSLRVCFPLPNGNLMVFLRPKIGNRGSLVLRSPQGSFGEDGTYLTVIADSHMTVKARRIAITERFETCEIDTDTLQTHHELWLCGLPVLKLRYVLRRN